MHWLMRMSKWARKPPSPQKVKIVFGVLAVCLVLAGIEALDLWPDWATTEPMGRGAPKGLGLR
jgi:hypothetical protein